MMDVFDGALARLRETVLGEPQDGSRPLLAPELAALASPPPERADEVILLCLLAARQGLGLVHLPWLLSTLAVNQPDLFRPYLPAIGALVAAPQAEVRELAVNLVGLHWRQGEKDLLPYLLQALHDREPRVVCAAVSHLRHCQQAQAAEVLDHCHRALTGDDLAPGAASLCTFEPPAEEDRLEVLYCFIKLALLLARRGLINEAALRRFLQSLQTPTGRLALPEPVREWLSQPLGRLPALLARYTEDELAALQWRV
ncbi:MAG: hypothetical protein ABFE07_22165 [Armatimonadia bacterium]